MPFHQKFPLMAVACALLLLAGCGVDAQPLSNTTSLPVNYAPDATVADLNSGAIATAQAAVDARPQDAAAWYQLGNAISVSAAEISDDTLRQASYNKGFSPSSTMKALCFSRASPMVCSRVTSSE